MTLQQIDAMKLALEALEDRSSLMKWQKARDAINEALAEHAMRETQRLGQEIEQEPVELCQYGQEPASCTSNPMDCQCAIDAALAQPEQEPVMWPCLIDSADFSENTITLVMQCEDYKVTAGKYWLSTTPSKETK